MPRTLRGAVAGAAAGPPTLQPSRARLCAGGCVRACVCLRVRACACVCVRVRACGSACPIERQLSLSWRCLDAPSDCLDPFLLQVIQRGPGDGTISVLGQTAQLDRLRARVPAEACGSSKCARDPPLLIARPSRFFVLLRARFARAAGDPRGRQKDAGGRLGARRVSFNCVPSYSS